MARVPEPDLAHAIRRCQNGDKQAFRLIADNHGERLYGIAFLIIWSVLFLFSSGAAFLPAAGVLIILLGVVQYSSLWAMNRLGT